MLSQSTWMDLPTACASPFGPSMTYLGPVTPRDARKTPLIDAKAAWDEFKPFHCEIGVVRTTNSGITSPQISTAAADRASSSWSALVQVLTHEVGVLMGRHEGKLHKQ